MERTGMEHNEPNWDLYLDAEPPEAEPVRVEERAAEPDRPDKAVLRTPLSHLLLSPRTVQRLEQQGIQTLGQLARLRLSQLRTMPGMGAKSQAEVLEALEYYALTLAPEPAPRPAQQLTLPQFNALPRLCLGCHTVLPPEHPEAFCSPACRPSRPRRKAQKHARTTGENTVQLPLEFGPD